MNTIVIICDGAASNNGREDVRAGAGAVIILENETHLLRISHETIAEKVAKYGYGITNNTAELVSLGVALNHLIKLGRNLAECDVIIKMDSSYAVGLLQKEKPNKAKANIGIVQALRSVLSQLGEYQLTHQPGHVGEHYNELADGLANEGKTQPDNTTIIKDGEAF